MVKGQIEKALKIFESALNELKITDANGEATHLYKGNNDLAALLVNYIKCNAIFNGFGTGSDYFRNDELNKKLFGYLQKVNEGIY